MTNCTTTGNFFATGGRHIEFEPNTLMLTSGVNSPDLDIESLIYTINALNGSVTGQTITLPSTYDYTAIYGTVSQITDINGNTADFFTLADSSTAGAVTVAYFVTNVKGWTLA